MDRDLNLFGPPGLVHQSGENVNGFSTGVTLRGFGLDLPVLVLVRRFAEADSFARRCRTIQAVASTPHQRCAHAVYLAFKIIRFKSYYPIWLSAWTMHMQRPIKF
jgi:hypothetical protein